MHGERMNLTSLYAVRRRMTGRALASSGESVMATATPSFGERIEDQMRPPETPQSEPKKELRTPDTVMDEGDRFVKLAKAGAYMAGDRRGHHNERPAGGRLRRVAGDRAGGRSRPPISRDKASRPSRRGEG